MNKTYLQTRAKNVCRISIAWVIVLCVVSCVPDFPKDESVDITSVNTADSMTTNLAEGKGYEKPIVKVYIENSGSMDGFVRPKTNEFKSDMHNFLSLIYSEEIADSMFLGYINSKIPYLQKVDSWREIDAFTQGLTIASFQKKGGKRTSTEFANLFDLVLQNTNDTVVSILISDCISDEDLQTMKSNVRTIFKANDNYRLSVGLLQYYSHFSGTYYCKNYHEKISDERPYYVWIIGNNNHVRRLMEMEREDAANSFAIVRGGQKVEYNIVPSSGTFRLAADDPKHAITKWKQDKITQSATMGVAVNFKYLMQTDDYLLDATNYEISDSDFSIAVTKSSIKERTHQLKLTSSMPKQTALSVKLKSNIPAWVFDSNDEIGNDIQAKMDRTYGILPLVEGVHEAFMNKSDYLAEIKITIK